MKKWTIQGVTDEVTSCDCCGRQDLKRTVSLLNTDTGAEVFFGTECAAQALELPAADVRKQSKKAQTAREELKRKQAQRKADEEMGRWVAFLVRETGTANIIVACEKLGGFGAARKRFMAES